MRNFFKYNSSGNDFIIIDNRDNSFLAKTEYIKKLCDRNFGIGADGLILLEKDSKANYFMNYFNSDGLISSFCGNGNLCCGHFANYLGLLNKDGENYNGTFSTREGLFHVNVNLLTNNVSISMPDVSDYGGCETSLQDFIINTGSPHYVSFRDSIDDIDVNKEGSRIRNSDSFKEGINATFVATPLFGKADKFSLEDDSSIHIRTYERGVESETLSCGTGVVAAALSEIIYYLFWSNSEKSTNTFFHSTTVYTLGGTLRVRFKCYYKHTGSWFDFVFSEIMLSNKVHVVFQGELPI